LDTGPVFLEQKVAISPQDTGGSLHDRLAALGASAVVEVLDELDQDRATSTPQREDGLTYASKIDKAEALIDWTHPAAAIERQVRAFNPWPIAETRLDGEQLRIYAAEAIEADCAGSAGAAGQIVDLRDEAIIVACGQGRLALKEVQRPGKRPVAARDLMNTLDLAGHRLG
jgi:methionyl-tRNA formyltransferase